MLSKVWDMLSKVWDSFEKVGLWILFGISMYFLFTRGFTDSWKEATLWLLVFSNARSIRALEKNQESQAS